MKRKLYTILAVLDILLFEAGAVLLICTTIWETVPIGVAFIWSAMFLSAVTIMVMLDILIGRYDDDR